jgi:hypothetical protein
MHHRPGQRPAARQTRRRAHGRFAALPAPRGSNIQTIDYGPYPVGATATQCHPEWSEGPAVVTHSHENTPLEPQIYRWDVEDYEDED